MITITNGSASSMICFFIECPRHGGDDSCTLNRCVAHHTQIEHWRACHQEQLENIMNSISNPYEEDK